MSLPATRHSLPATSTLRVSVVIPTHNPRMDYLRRVLEALRGQTLARERWELLVVDNGSREPLAEGGERMADGGERMAELRRRETGDRGQETGGGDVECGGRSAERGGLKPTNLKLKTLDLGWHARARVVREERLGLTNARLCGFAETTGEVVVLVDDDNVLAPDYLEQVVRIAREYPFIGTWSGALELELEPGSPEPPQELRHLLCERIVERDLWSNDPSHFRATPWGAGECVRRSVAQAYAEKVAREPRRRQLDLQGEQLVYGGDTDIAYTGLDMGLGMGVFASLRITHLISRLRCSEDYLLKHHEARAYSEVLHHWIEHGTSPQQRTDLRGRLGLLFRKLFGNPLERKMIAARRRGLVAGQDHLDGKTV